MEFNGKNYVKGKCLKIIRIISMMVMALIVKMKKIILVMVTLK